MLSQTVEYALRAMLHLADWSPKGRTTDEIAEVTQVPKAYLSKVIQGLSRAGLVKSRRGVGGGVALSRPPSEVTMLEVVEAVEPIGRIATCPLGLKAHGTRLCPLHRRLDDALAHVEEAFRRTTLAEVLADPSSSVPLCDFPGPRSSDGASRGAACPEPIRDRVHEA